MDFDLFSCTFENLNSLKFNELQKLSSQYRVNKRWAKKREIIDKLLLLRDKELGKRNLIINNVEKNVDSQGNEKWVDGKEVFLSDVKNEASNNDEIDRRLTYTVDTPIENDMERRLTFNVVKNEGNKMARDVNLEMYDKIDRRLTYNADEIKKMNMSLNYASTISKEQINIEEAKTAAHFEGNVENVPGITATNKREKDNHVPNKQLSLIQEIPNTNRQEIHTNIKSDGKLLEPSQNSTKTRALKPTKTKMLTIPYSRIPTQSRRSVEMEAKDSNFAKVKPPEKLPTTSKLTKSRIAANKTQNPLEEKDTQLPSKVAGIIKPLFDEENTNNTSTSKQNLSNPSLKNELSNMNNPRRNFPRRKSKTEDNVLVSNLKSRINPKFFTPTKDTKSLKRLSDGNSHHFDNNLGSKIPKAKPMVEITKHLTAKKMPNFSKIHQRQFDQMDSILDYKRKKEERAKKLFGIPQPGALEKENKGNEITELFQFKSLPNEKENQTDKARVTNKLSLQTDMKQFRKKPNRQNMMNHAGSKTNIVTNVKEQNRKQLNGVRTNKRFELQMKFRKM